MSNNLDAEDLTYLTYKLGEEIFALGINQVREVLDYKKITKIPRTPDFVTGVINVRGEVVPVVDMRIKFGFEAAGQTVNTCIIIMEFDIEGDLIQVGALADSVEEVLNFEADQIEPAPRIGTNLRIDFIKGMGKIKEQFVIILDIDKIFSTEELNMVREAEKIAA